MDSNPKKILVSGVKPTGRPHVGNYFGAMREFVSLEDSYDARIFIADYHALTTLQDARELRRNTLDVAIDYLAIGLDPTKVLLFKQSDIPELTELTWIFNCLVTKPFLERAHAYKDALAKGLEVNAGTFSYPVLMAADILAEDADVVPVGQDQKQHIEYARDIAEKFNRIFGDTFRLPEALISEATKIIPGIDGQKMSKSYGNTIPLFATDEEIETLVKKIPTDSASVDEPKDPETNNLFSFHRLFTPKEELGRLETRYREGGVGYKESKDILIADMRAFIAPLREKRAEIASNEKNVLSILREGGEKAREMVSEKMKIVRERTGLSA